MKDKPPFEDRLLSLLVLLVLTYTAGVYLGMYLCVKFQLFLEPK